MIKWMMYAPDGVLATFQGEIQHTKRSCYLGKIARKRRQGVRVDSKLETPNCTHGTQLARVSHLALSDTYATGIEWPLTSYFQQCWSIF
jgi:hypothetical protein